MSAFSVLLIVSCILAMPSLKIKFLDSTWYALFNVVLLGVTVGCVGTFSMIIGCSSSKETGGYIMSFHLTLGLALGSLFAVLLGYLLV